MFLRIAIVLVFLAARMFGGAQSTLFVSPGGSGTSFSQTQPGNLFAARDLIRTMSPSMTGNVVVYLYGGTYQLTNSFQLQENTKTHDSGTGGYNIVYEGYPGQIPIISGGIVVTNWSLFNASSNIWSAFVGIGVNSRQLYVNGVRAMRARSTLTHPVSQSLRRVSSPPTWRCSLGGTLRILKLSSAMPGNSCGVLLLLSAAQTLSCRRRAGPTRELLRHPAGRGMATARCRLAA